MNWLVKIDDEAQLFIDNLPSKIRRQLVRSINQLETDPFRGDAKALQGKRWKNYYRKRTGNYRIVFLVHYKEKIVDISSILLRQEKTYR